jgi:acetyltransferase-like isoleucine patch superfamily enzyme
MKGFSMLKKVFSLIKNQYEIRKYMNYNIAEYFRMQGAQIGEDCFFSIRTLSSEPFLIKIGNHVGVASGVQFLTHSLGWSFRDRIPDLQVFGKIVIGNNCNIGVNAIILPNVTIGDNCVIAAGAIVIKDIPSNSIVAGVPGKVIGNTDDYFEKARKTWEAQKPEGYLAELQPGKTYSPAYFDSVRSKPEYRKLLRNHLTKLFWGEER